MSAETPVQSVGTFTRLRLRFRDWRGGRPFWAGLFTLLGGLPIAYFPYATLKLGTMAVSMATTAGAGSLIIGLLLVTLGLTMWFQQATRIFAGVAAILLALVSLVVSNIGGFIVGFVLALLGGALSIAWVPDRKTAPVAADAPADDSTGYVPADGTTGYVPAPRAGDEHAPLSEGAAAQSARTDDSNGGYRVG
ncbi:DUF6114 domain-containing protein [Streptomyces sp. NPDC090023]|uniref:DUF6114 domain-containing protein n=1 Tax=unclassified Streptomyces TaxID=2593676 RepID=UPI0037F97EDC